MDFVVDGQTSDIYYISSNLVYKYSPSTQTNEIFAGGGDLSGDFVPAKSATLEIPSTLAIDSTNGDLIIAESRKIKRVRNKIISTVAGGGHLNYEYKGPVTNLKEYMFRDIGSCQAHDGTIYFYEFFHKVLFKISKDGSMVNILGNGYGAMPQNITIATASPGYLQSFSVNPQSNEIFFGSESFIMKVDQNGYIRFMSNMTSKTARIQDVYDSPRPDDGMSPRNLFIGISFVGLSPITNEFYFAQPKERIAKIVNFSSNNRNDWKIQTIAGSKSYYIENIPAIYSRLDYASSVVFKPDSNEWFFNNDRYYRRTVQQKGDALQLVQTFFIGDKAQRNIHISFSETEPIVYYTTDAYLYKMNYQTMETTIFAGNGRHCYPQDGSPQLESCVSQSGGIAVSPYNGQVYFMMSGTAYSIIFTFENGRIKMVAGGGKDIYSSNVMANETSLGIGSTFAIGSQNDIYVSDSKNRIIKFISANGLVSVVAGSKDATDYGHDGIKATDAAISPHTLAVLPYGDIIFAEDNRIRKVSKKTGLLSTIYGDFESGYTPNGIIQPGDSTFFKRPQIMGSIKGKNEIFLIDQPASSSAFTSQIRKIETSCDLGEYLDEDWKSCLKCPPGKYSSSDFSGCDGELVYCYGIPFTSPNVCSAHGKCTMSSQCQCQVNWSGSDCSETTCNSISSKDSNVCGGNGKCITYNQCQCKDGLFGQSCL